MRGRRVPLAAGAAAGAAIVAWCGWVSGFHRDTSAATVTWVCSLCFVVLIDLVLWRAKAAGRGGRLLRSVPDPWPRPGRGGPRRALCGVGPWLGLAVVAVAWDVLGLDTGPHAYHLTISALTQAYRPLNAALLLGWLVVGVAYPVARLRAPDVSRAGARHGGAGGDGAAPLGSSTPVLVAGGLVRAGWHLPAPALLLPQDPAAGVAFWVALPVAALGVELVARRSGGRVATAEEVVRFVSTAPLVNAGLMVAWVAAGYHLFAR